MPVITISRKFGAGGHTLGVQLANRLTYRLLDREIIGQIAEKANVSTKFVEAVEMESGNLLMQLVSEFAGGRYMVNKVRDKWVDLDRAEYTRFLTKVIQEASRNGNVIIIGRGGQLILPPDRDTIKILLVGELEDRIKFITEKYELSKAKAEKWIHKEEKRRGTFLSAFSARNPDDPDLYTIVLNTSLVGLKEAEDIIVQMVENVVSPATGRDAYH